MGFEYRLTRFEVYLPVARSNTLHYHENL